MTKKLCKELRELGDDEDYKILFEWFANAGQHRDETSVDHLKKRTGIERQYIVDFFKRLESIGVGTFIVGRHGKRSRIFLRYERSDIGEAGLGSLQKIEPRYEDDEEPSALEDDKHVQKILKSFQKTISVVLGCDRDAISISINVLDME